MLRQSTTSESVRAVVRTMLGEVTASIADFHELRACQWRPRSAGQSARTPVPLSTTRGTEGSMLSASDEAACNEWSTTGETATRVASRLRRQPVGNLLLNPYRGLVAKSNRAQQTSARHTTSLDLPQQLRLSLALLPEVTSIC